MHTHTQLAAVRRLGEGLGKKHQEQLEHSWLPFTLIAFSPGQKIKEALFKLELLSAL